MSMTVSAGDHTLLREEAIAIAKYLTGREPEEFIIDRYISGVHTKFSNMAETNDRAIESFIQKYPSALSCIDAASAILYPRRLLRKKILLMVAILETTPEYCGYFFPTRFSKSLFIFKTFAFLLKTSIQAFVGLILLAAVKLQRQ